MMQVLGRQHLRQQAGGGHSVVDDVRRHRRLGDLLTAPAHPLAANVALDREHARLVVKLLDYVLTNALQRLAASAGGVLGPWWISWRGKYAGSFSRLGSCCTRWWAGCQFAAA